MVNVQRDAIAEQIREALHKRIDEGVRSDW